MVCLSFRCLKFLFCVFSERGERELLPLQMQFFEDDIGENQSVQDEIPLAPRRRGRGRGRGRGRVRPQPVAAPEVEQEPLVEPEAPEVNPVVYAADIVGINQGLAALNRAMLLVQQKL